MSVDIQSPWLGLASFTEETRGFFFGREEEVAELERRVQRKLLTILFGKSGLGKTSILQAGLVPGLRARGYFPVYLRIDYGRDSPDPAEQIKQAIHRAAGDMGASGEATSATLALDPAESIWEFLHHRDDVLKDAAGRTLIPLLIFDQFEELFTLAQSDEFGRARAARFVEELADLVENRPPKALEAKLEAEDSMSERFDFSRSDYRVVIALREDYLAPLESLKKQMPSLSQNRLRLAPMTGVQALQAVLLPGKQLVSQEVAEAIVRFVAGGSEITNAEVEPSLLSLICRELNEQRISQQRPEISLDLLAGSHESILSSFYERSLADQPAAVRQLIEDELLTESGYRENLAEERLLRRLQASGAAPDALAVLVNRRLLRIEERLDVRRVELTHDVLTGVVKASRDLRHEREAREATERLLAEQAAREQSARRALRRARSIAIGCTLLAAIAIVAAGLAFVSVRRANVAETEAQQTRQISEQARVQAQGLLGYLTYSFVRELETFGRYQTIAELSQREIDYFHALPTALKESQTIRSGAMARVNHANALLFLGDLVAAAKEVTEAITVLEQLRRTDSSTATTVALADAYLGRAVIAFNQTDPGGLTDGSRALALLRPITDRADASEQARRAYVESLDQLATWGASIGSGARSDAVENQAAARAREAMDQVLKLGARRVGDVTLDADYAGAGPGLVSSLQHFGRTDEALRAGEELLAVANEVLAKRPQYGSVLVTKQSIDEGLDLAELDALDPAAAMRFGLDDVHTALALSQLEPNNMLYVRNAANAHRFLSFALWSAGQLRESIAQTRAAIDEYRRVPSSSSTYTDFIAVLTEVDLGVNQATLGDTVQAAPDDTVIKSATAGARSALGSTPGTFALVQYSASGLISEQIAYERDDFAEARRISRDTLAHLRAVGHRDPNPASLCLMADTEGAADYNLRDFAAAEQAQRVATQACSEVGNSSTSDRRGTAVAATWLAMALAAEGKRGEAARVIDPVVAMDLAMEAKNRSDAWLPLEVAGALYAQALAEPQRRTALLQGATQRIAHLKPAIAALHDTRWWRTRIEAALHTAPNGADR
jgi:tetratricopeptide (TPR) repeat protein